MDLATIGCICSGLINFLNNNSCLLEISDYFHFYQFTLFSVFFLRPSFLWLYKIIILDILPWLNPTTSCSLFGSREWKECKVWEGFCCSKLSIFTNWRSWHSCNLEEKRKLRNYYRVYSRVTKEYIVVRDLVWRCLVPKSIVYLILHFSMNYRISFY